MSCSYFFLIVSCKFLTSAEIFKYIKFRVSTFSFIDYQLFLQLYKNKFVKLISLLRQGFENETIPYCVLNVSTDGFSNEQNHGKKIGTKN